LSYGTTLGQQTHSGVEVQPSTHGKPPIKSQDQPCKKITKHLWKKNSAAKKPLPPIFNNTLN
jgi:hypothetical protein